MVDCMSTERVSYFFLHLYLIKHFMPHNVLPFVALNKSPLIMS